jgi:hypothetical protein
MQPASNPTLASHFPMSTLERGFKSWAERLGTGIRRDLGLPPDAPLPMTRLADYLGITLWTPRDVPGLPREVLHQLLDGDPGGWSAVTLVAEDQTTVIYNPRHSDGRRQSNMAHELAHLLLDHEPAKVILAADGTMAMRTYDAVQEDEAAWLSGCLLLPRAALLLAARSGRTAAQVAEEFEVSVPMVEYRLRVTGVVAQARRARALRKA